MSNNPGMRSETERAVELIRHQASQIYTVPPHQSTITADMVRQLRQPISILAQWLDEVDRIRDTQSYSKAKHDAKKKRGLMRRTEDAMSRLFGGS